MNHEPAFPNLIDSPERILLQQGDAWYAMQKQGQAWAWHDVEVITSPVGRELRISLKAEGEGTAVSRVALFWDREMARGMRILGDHWERGYGDLEWRGLVPERVMPWFFLMHDGYLTSGYGVMTGPKAMCSWQVNDRTISLCLDVRCGGEGVLLHGRDLLAATVISRLGLEHENPFQAAAAFCRLMSPSPLMPDGPVYGGNNWYYAYGKSSHTEILEDAAFMSSLAPGGPERPFMVIDDGWQLQRDTTAPDLWQQGNARFPDMALLAGQMKDAGVRPGLWVRPLIAPDNVDNADLALCLPAQRFKTNLSNRFLDPSLPEVLDRVRADIARAVGWGYELVKHDYTTFDILGRWGFEMSQELTQPGWRFHDTGKTTAEIITDLYQVIRQASGSSMIIGCNTIGHLAAGLVEMQRTGDDTSGHQWERTRKMGVNTLAFTLPRHGAFFAIDADCAGITTDIPWEQNRQWLELLAKSGTPLFVSASPKTGGVEKLAIREAFAQAIAIASQAIASYADNRAEPLDWMETTCPARWMLQGKEMEFDWYRKDRIEFCI